MPAFLALVVATALPNPVTFTSALVFGPFNSGGRTPCPTDPVAYHLVMGDFRSPRNGDILELPNGSKASWSEIKAGNDGWFENRALGGGYAYMSFDSDKSKAMLLDASGHSLVYVNGVPRAGDPYAFGFVQLPVAIKKGKNEFLFSVGRGRVRATLTDIPSEVTVTLADPTLPDAVIGENKPLLCSVLLRNATDKTFVGRIRGTLEGRPGPWAPARISPMTVGKAAFWTAEFSPQAKGKSKLRVELAGAKSDTPLSTQEFEIDDKTGAEVCKRTFESSVDKSVQYYAVQPASAPNAKALVLSLHGASVEATGQAAAYGQKPWCNVVCPTNGRPYGFDWEDWGRINALDALADAKRVYSPDPDKIYLTGHSMGGHGTWSIGFNNPSLFSAIAPCAGWISFWSYAGGADWKDPDQVENLLRRAANPSDTLLLLDNASDLGIFIQHGDKDDNVPVEQAREMRERLSKFHHDFDWHEEPGQSHWFDTDPEAGANVEDYAPLFDFLAKHRIRSQAERRLWSLTTVNLMADHSAANLSILSQSHSALPSKLNVRTYADGSYEEATTENVHALAVSDMFGHDHFKLKVDGQDFPIDASSGPAFLVQTSGRWEVAQKSTATDRTASPNFKASFGRVLVYGTKGPKEQAEWSYNKARFDAETWWYRGNGTFQTIPDTDWEWRGNHGPGSLVLYGNSECNGAIKAFEAGLSSTGFESSASSCSVGSKTWSGDFGFVTLSATKGDPQSCVGVVGGTSLKGLKTCDRLPLFLSGVHYADVFVARPDMYMKGSKGVAATGFFGPDWSFQPDEFASRD